jgi:hypothetical protein
MKTINIFVLFAGLALVACSTPTPAPTAPPINVQFTAAAAPWLSPLYTCAGSSLVFSEQRSADFLDLTSADFAIRLGQPATLASPAYQIGTDDLLVITNPHNPLTRLTPQQVSGIFSGTIQNWSGVGGADAPLQVWVYPSSEDTQTAFDQLVLAGRPVVSSARLATTSDEMITGVAGDPNAIGILTRRLKTDAISEIYTVGSLPVLALTQGNPTPAIMHILSCLQK